MYRGHGLVIIYYSILWDIITYPCFTLAHISIFGRSHLHYLNLFSIGRCVCDFKYVNFKHNFGIVILSIEVTITLEWMLEDLVDGKSTLVQVMAWCHQAWSHYQNQYWPRSLRPYDLTKPQLVKHKRLTTSVTNLSYVIISMCSHGNWGKSPASRART